MEKLQEIKDSLIQLLYNQLECLECINAEEMGEVVDMVKDIEEAIYYCTITEAMEKKYSCPEVEDEIIEKVKE